ncbi:MAG: Rid family detoxifying hydrolase [Acholeplasmataceae bacterium]|jgi:2-iminobutanoate/2-iminopropanoate deaminase
MIKIHTPNAPAAVGPYSQGIVSGQTLYVSGQLPFVAETMTLISPEVKDQTRKSLENILSIVEAAGFYKENIVKCTVYMKDLSKFSEMNEAYQIFFQDHKPARVAVEVSRLPKDVDVEIDAIAIKD